MMQSIHFDGLPFPDFAATITSHDLRRDETGMPMQPPAQHDRRGKPRRLPGQIDEYGLRHVLGEMRVAVHEPHGGGINEIHVTGYHLPKRGFRSGPNILRQAMLAVVHFFSVKTRLRLKPDKNKSSSNRKQSR